MVPRGGLPRSKKIKVLRKSGTANFTRSSLGFLPTVSHRSLIASSPTNEAMSANATCSGIGTAQSSSLFTNGSLSDPAKNEILVPPESSSEKVNSSAEQELACSRQEPFSGRLSIEVDRPPARTTATWGITGPELNRLNDAVQFMDLHCERGRCDLWLLTTAGATPRPL